MHRQPARSRSLPGSRERSPAVRRPHHRDRDNRRGLLPPPSRDLRKTVATGRPHRPNARRLHTSWTRLGDNPSRASGSRRTRGNPARHLLLGGLRNIGRCPTRQRHRRTSLHRRPRGQLIVRQPPSIPTGITMRTMILATSLRIPQRDTAPSAGTCPGAGGRTRSMTANSP